MSTHIFTLSLDDYADILFEVRKEIILILNEKVRKEDKLVIFYKSNWDEKISEECLLISLEDVRPVNSSTTGKLGYYLKFKSLECHSSRSLITTGIIQTFRLPKN